MHFDLVMFFLLNFFLVALTWSKVSCIHPIVQSEGVTGYRAKNVEKTYEFRESQEKQMAARVQLNHFELRLRSFIKDFEFQGSEFSAQAQRSHISIDAFTKSIDYNVLDDQTVQCKLNLLQKILETMLYSAEVLKIFNLNNLAHQLIRNVVGLNVALQMLQLPDSGSSDGFENKSETIQSFGDLLDNWEESFDVLANVPETVLHVFSVQVSEARKAIKLMKDNFIILCP